MAQQRQESGRVGKKEIDCLSLSKRSEIISWLDTQAEDNLQFVKMQQAFPKCRVNPQ